jgi:hypothetical protein
VYDIGCPSSDSLLHPTTRTNSGDDAVVLHDACSIPWASGNAQLKETSGSLTVEHATTCRSPDHPPQAPSKSINDPTAIEMHPSVTTPSKLGELPRQRHHAATSLHELRNVLSSSESIAGYTTQRLKFLYATVKRAQLLPRLQSSDFSKLISILGTLSTSAPCVRTSSTPAASRHPPHNIFVYPPALSMGLSSFSLHLGFVREVFMDKRRYHEHTLSDHYWMMHLKIMQLQSRLGNGGICESFPCNLYIPIITGHLF